MKEDVFWKALNERDKRFDGTFFTCVKSTGIFCRPSCPARKPRRENVEFALSSTDAEGLGYRACLRCNPKSTVFVEPKTSLVLKVCALLDSGDCESLDDISRFTGFSRYHIQRSFSEIIGISPKKYLEARRLAEFKSEIRGGAEIVKAVYESGFGSGSRLYEEVGAKLGMTPASYKKGGTGILIEYVAIDCEFGKLLAAQTEKGICAVTLGDSEDVLVDALRSEFPNAELRKGTEGMNETARNVANLAEGKLKQIDLPLDLKATAFQLRVWSALREIPRGETRSYKQIAEKIGNSKSFRAVARACATNRIAVVIPCHRVIGSGGSLSGYRWGVERKKNLLEAESATPERPSD